MTIVMSARALNRATLARQLLLERAEIAPSDAVAHLVGLQAQIPQNPYLALWSRLVAFDPMPLSHGIERHECVRIVVMRGTIHLVTADDALRLRPLTQPVMDREIARHSEFAPQLLDVDTTEPLAFAADLLAREQLTTSELRHAIAQRFPGSPDAALAYACRCLLPLVQVPPRGLWQRSGAVRVAHAESWIGRPVERRPSADELVLRYFAAFGPATVADLASWSRLTGMRAWVERVRDHLIAVRDVDGRELLDVPDGPRPGEDVPAPVRVLPEYDNVLLSHADRSRFHRPGVDAALTNVTAPVHGTVLHDGTVAAVWTQTRAGRRVRWSVQLLASLADDAIEEIEAETIAAQAFVEPEAERSVAVLRA